MSTAKVISRDDIASYFVGTADDARVVVREWFEQNYTQFEPVFVVANCSSRASKPDFAVNVLSVFAVGRYGDAVLIEDAAVTSPGEYTRPVPKFVVETIGRFHVRTRGPAPVKRWYTMGIFERVWVDGTYDQQAIRNYATSVHATVTEYRRHVAALMRTPARVVRPVDAQHADELRTRVLELEAKLASLTERHRRAVRLLTEST